MVPFRKSSGTTTRRRATLAFIAAIGLGVVASACGDSPIAPSAPPAANHDLLTTTTSLISTVLTPVTGLLWATPVLEKTVSTTIGPAGGTLSMPNGAQLIVPKGAVTTNVTFSITRLAGNIVAYDFQPHGMVFATPLTIQQPASGTNLLSLSSTKSVQGAYFPSSSLLDQLLGTAKVSEFEPTVVSPDKQWITFTVKHFSGYMVSTGR